jgi:hypothetical protein
MLTPANLRDPALAGAVLDGLEALLALVGLEPADALAAPGMHWE